MDFSHPNHHRLFLRLSLSNLGITISYFIIKGRPKGVTPKFCLKPLMILSQGSLSFLELSPKVIMSNDCIGEEVEKLVASLPEGALADLYVNDAFGIAHRAHASTEGVTKYLKPSVAGYLMQKERQIFQLVEETVPLRHHERQTSIRKKWAEENTTLDFHSNTRICDFGGNLRLGQRNLFKLDFSEDVSSSSSYPRRSFCHMRQKPSVDDDYQLTSSFNYPTYMAATESAKAKMRSLSTPRQRVGHVDACFEDESPYKSDRPCHWSSSNCGSKTTSALWQTYLIFQFGFVFVIMFLKID